MSRKGPRDDARRGTRTAKATPGEVLASASGPPTTTEGIVARLLSPEVEPSEAAEYASWVGQFDHLSLGQDLSDKAALLYETSASVSDGSGRGVQVDRASVSLYESAVASSSI